MFRRSASSASRIQVPGESLPCTINSRISRNAVSKLVPCSAFALGEAAPKTGPHADPTPHPATNKGGGGAGSGHPAANGESTGADAGPLSGPATVDPQDGVAGWYPCALSWLR